MPSPERTDPDVYREPPSRTPAPNPETSIPNPVDLLVKAYEVVVDAPITAWRNFIERQHEKNRYYYYHRQFRRIPDITECLQDDYVCYFEAEMQWRRDKQVDGEILKIVQDRLSACSVREGANHFMNCKGELEQFKEVVKAYNNKYGDLGFHGNARTCLMKQKHRMIAERKAAKAAASH